jgi:hypothetical protein
MILNGSIPEAYKTTTRNLLDSFHFYCQSYPSTKLVYQIYKAKFTAAIFGDTWKCKALLEDAMKTLEAEKIELPFYKGKLTSVLIQDSHLHKL